MTIKCEQKNELFLNSYNLNYSISSFNELIYKHIKKKDKAVVCLLNISNFKLYNYKFGYEYGDKILEAVFNKVKKNIKNMGYIYRCGCDILIFLFNEITYKSDVITIIDGILNIFNNPIRVGEEKLKIVINMGICIYPDDSIEIDNILKYAEIALSCSKKNYIDKYKFFKYGMYEDIMSRGKIEADIVNAIYNDEFILYYQPQVDVKTMKVYGMEALLRWNHPERGIIPPIYFIDIVEQNGMINEIGKLVFEKACSQLKIWNELGYDNLSMSVNISEKQLEENSFLTFIENILKKTQVNPKYINIEITERILMNSTENILNILSALRQKGMKIFIDDFGTKYSSLNYLYRFHVDGIKIDKSFIDKIQYSEKEYIITKNIVNLAQELNIDVVAEGVEESAQLKKLGIINCTKIQGFIFQKPVVANEFIDFVNKFNS